LLVQFGGAFGVGGQECDCTGGQFGHPFSPQARFQRELFLSRLLFQGGKFFV
jgi:hypothetical protein